MAAKKKTASDESLETGAAGVEETGPYYKLADPTVSFVDPDTDFRLVGKQVKPIGEGAGKLTLQWIRAGGLIEADAPTETTEPTGEAEQ